MIALIGLLFIYAGTLTAALVLTLRLNRRLENEAFTLRMRNAELAAHIVGVTARLEQLVGKHNGRNAP